MKIRATLGRSDLCIRKCTVSPSEGDLKRPSKIKQQIKEWIDEVNATRIYSFGLCGAISPDLHVGDVVFIKAAREYKRAEKPDLGLKPGPWSYGITPRDKIEQLEAAARNLSKFQIEIEGVPTSERESQFRIGNAITADWFPMPHQYQKMWQNECEPEGSTWVVEQEEFHVLELVASLGIEYYPIRVVTDPLDIASLTAALLKAFDKELRDKGRTPSLREYLRTNPNDIQNMVTEASDDTDLNNAVAVRFLYEKLKRRFAEHCFDVMKALLT